MATAEGVDRHILVVGLNHRSAPIELRERLAVQQAQLPELLARVREEAGLQEAAVLSTCNRVEIYGRVQALDGAVDRLHRFLGGHGGIEPTSLSSRLYSYTEPESVRHLFAVASGLDSMVLGEAEILQQVKQAYEQAKACGATGKVLNALFQRALNAAKAVRTHTGIGRGSTSVGSVAVELAQKIFGGLNGRVVLLIGAGTMGEATLQRLADRGVRDVRIMNRSFERAARLAADHRASAVPIEQMPAQLLEADIVITSTAAPAYLVGRAAVVAAMHTRHQRPLCLIDLGVPRNVEPATAGLDNAYVFDIDDLEGLVQHSHQERQRALSASQAIIDQKVDRFLAWWQDEARMAGGGLPGAPRDARHFGSGARGA